jgi:hypothetical protein
MSVEAWITISMKIGQFLQKLTKPVRTDFVGSPNIGWLNQFIFENLGNFENQKKLSDKLENSSDKPEKSINLQFSFKI